MGIVVTGSGPHAGDLAAPRFGFEIRTVAWVHADLVIAFIGTVIAYLLLLTFAPVVPDNQSSHNEHAGSHRAHRLTEVRWILGIALAQGGIGYLQYFTGVPELLVAAHLLGVVILWNALIRHAIRVKAFSRSG